MHIKKYISPELDFCCLSAYLTLLASSFGEEGKAGNDLSEDEEHSYYF